MARAPLSRLEDWELDHQTQDLRNHMLVDERGTPIGTIREMIVDTDAERVASIVLENGTEYPVSAFEIRNGTAILRGQDVRATSGDTAAIPLLEERLGVQRRTTQVGEVEITKRVVTEQQTLEVPLEREEVHVEQRAVEPRPADRPIGDEEETIRVPIMGEEAVVQKETIVTGEVVIGKHAVTESHQVTDTVRRTEVDVESRDEATADATSKDAAQRA